MKSTRRLICLALTLLLALSLCAPAFADGAAFAGTQKFIDGIQTLDGLRYMLKPVVEDGAGNSLEQLDLFYKGDKADRAFHITAYFPEDGGSAFFRIYDLVKADSDEAFGDLFIKANALNATFSWVKFYVEEDGSVTADMDILATPDTMTEVGVSALARLIAITNEAYGVLTAAE